jgi:hypothetical protein
MNKKERKKQIFEEIRADQARYDDVTRRLKAAIDVARARQERRASS